MKRLFSLVADYIRETDKIMLLLVFAASSFGCIAVMSATAHTGSLGEFITQVIAMFGGLGIAIISTNKGILTDKEARALNVGGEVLAFIW